MTIDLDELASRAVAETPTRVPSPGEIRDRAQRRRRRSRTVAAAVMLPIAIFVVVGGVALVERAGSGPDAVTTDEPADTVPPTSVLPYPTIGECATPPLPDTASVVGNAGAASLDEMARSIWPFVAGDLPILDLSTSSYQCSLTIETPAGGFTVSGYQAADGRWYLGYVGPTAQDPDFGLGVTWLRDGTIKVYSDVTCDGCVSSEVTAFAASGSWVARSGIPLAVEMDAPGSDGERVLLIRYFDASGSVRRVSLTPIRSGDFAAG
jgi:hypothetical protein